MSIRKPTSLLGGIVLFIISFAFVGVVASCAITIGIWPGQVKLLAPLFCTDAQPDAFVVADTYSPRPGETVTNFSLYCMGPRGDATDHGFLKPFLLISVLNGLFVFIILFIVGKPLRSSQQKKTAFIEQFAPDETDADDRVETAPPWPTASDGDDTPTRSPAPPGSTAGPFVD